MTEPYDAVKGYFVDGFAKVEGWCSPIILPIVGQIAGLQKGWGIEGCACEIGVFQGKFFLGLACAVEGRPAVAIDVFDRQDLNVDNSGAGTPDLLGRFRANVGLYAPHPERVVAIQTDSFEFSSDRQYDFLKQYGKVQLFSIDGGHSPEHVINDFRIAEALTLGGGMIIVDDITNSGWPGVYEGIARLFILGRPRFVPLLLGRNKLFLVGYSYHQRFLERLAADLPAAFPDTAFLRVKLFGYDILAVTGGVDTPATM